eukprot:GHRR01015608.1.p1 GENE.GHRR01015608.1~~GHRR01015608.1.p1  ORF type:complete len:482 (+),score=168.20 GHRR01015608.1:1054-2499(+)
MCILQGPLAKPSIGTTDGSAAVQFTPSAVKVAVVVRPMLDFELQKAAGNSVAVVPPNKVSLPARPIPTGGVNDGAYDFKFDRVYHAAGTGASQTLYQEMVRPVIDRFCQGFNGTVLAYGQTGSGKTYTMGTAASVKDICKGGSCAVIPQACSQLLQHVVTARDRYDVQVKVSFVEIYNEALQDLQALTSTMNSHKVLTHVTQQSGSPTPSRSASQDSLAAASDAGSGGITIRETAKGEIVLEGVIETAVSSMQELAQLLEHGNAVRATAAHRMNQASSRSHAVLSITLEQRARPAAQQQLPAELRYLRSKLHLVDLAGSERAKETGTTGQRFAEGVSINKGLLELGNVINALTESTARKHIPYRNSKLTRLLQDSLGGNSETLFIACISPADTNRDHTISTCRYASRAMAIKNSLKLNNQLTAEEEVAYLRQMVAELQEENERLRKLMAAHAAPTAGTAVVTTTTAAVVTKGHKPLGVASV